MTQFRWNQLIFNHLRWMSGYDVLREVLVGCWYSFQDFIHSLLPCLYLISLALIHGILPLFPTPFQNFNAFQNSVKLCIMDFILLFYLRGQFFISSTVSNECCGVWNFGLKRWPISFASCEVPFPSFFLSCSLVALLLVLWL